MKNFGLNRFKTKRGNGVMRQHIHGLGLLGCFAVLSMGAMAHGQLIWSNGPAMSTPRGRHTATVLKDGRILIVGGSTSFNTWTTGVEIYDPASNIYQPTGSLNVPRNDHSATLLPDGRVLVIGGYANYRYLSSAEIYNPASGTWSVTQPVYSHGVYHYAILLLDGRVLVVGGSMGGDPGPNDRVEIFDPARNTWSAASNHEGVVGGGGAALLNDGRVLFTGGRNTNTYLYTPSNDTWQAGGAISVLKAYPVSVLLPDGRVMVIGGVARDNDLSHVDIYDPVARAWRQAAPLGQGRVGHTATALPDGRVVVVGGFNSWGGDWYNPSNYLNSVEIYNPATGQWEHGPALRSRRGFHTSVLLQDGRLFVAGGHTSAYLNSTEIAIPTLSQCYIDKLNDYASATVRYFTSPKANNMLVGFTHTFYGTGPFQCQDDNGTWREWTNWSLTRGYGSHVCINEVTLRFLSLATAYKMNWLTNLPAAQRYSSSWGQILMGLQTLHSMQTSGNLDQYVSSNFHRIYLTTKSPNDRDRTVAEIACDSNNKQSSDDNGLPWMNLLLLEGLANDASTSIPDRATITNLCGKIRNSIDLTRFIVDDQIVLDFTDGVPSPRHWDRMSTEGPVILSAMLLSKQISTSQFYQIAGSFENNPVNWNTHCYGIIPIAKPSWHAAMCMHRLRAIHGLPVTAAEFSTNIAYFIDSVRPVTEAHIDYALCNGYCALGSHVSSQELWGIPMPGPSDALYMFPGNERNVWPIKGESLPPATASHAFFMPLQRWKYLSFYEYLRHFSGGCPI